MPPLAIFSYIAQIIDHVDDLPSLIVDDARASFITNPVAWPRPDWARTSLFFECGGAVSPRYLYTPNHIEDFVRVSQFSQS